jgi:hypothetical protein
LLIVSCGFGFIRLSSFLEPKQGAILLSLLALTFGGLSFYHLAVRYHHIWDQESTWRGYAKSIERMRAYNVLEKIQKEKGPGLIFSDFNPGLCDQTLNVADHSFNAAQNPDLSVSQAHWAAVLTNINYKPFLQNHFPGGKSYWLSENLAVSDGGFMLWVMPLTPFTEKAMEAWKRADGAFCCFPGRYTSILRANLVAAYSAFQADPFLEACYWEKLADLDFRLSDFKDPSMAIRDLEQGLKKGYGAAHLYERLAIFHFMRSEIIPEKEALRKAVSAPLDLTQSRKILQSLETSEDNRKIQTP